MNCNLDTLRKDLKWAKLLLLLAEVLLFSILAVASSSHYGVADGAKITLAYLVAYLVPRIVLSRARASSLSACLVLLVLAAFLIYVDFMRLKTLTFFDEFTLERPNLLGDSRNYYKWALNKFDGRVEETHVSFPGYPMMILALWRVLGVSVIWPQAMNLMFTLSSVVLTGMTTRRLLSHRTTVSPSALLTGGMTLSLLLFYYMFMGTAMLKEASIYISMAMTGFALSSMDAGENERHKLWRDFILFVMGCALLALVRTTYLYFVVIGLVLMSFSNLRRDWRISLAMLGILIVALLAGNYFSDFPFNRHAEVAGGGWNMQRFYVKSDSQRVYHDLLNYYFLYPTWHKALMLPLTITVQFLIPLPWAYYENPALLNMLSRATYGWYVIGGIALFYFIYVSWRRGSNMGWWPWWAAIAYAAMAYVMAGSVARYVTPLQPLFIPVAMYVLCRLYTGQWRKAFLWWSIIFVILIAAALATCIEIQQAAISKMLGTRPLVECLKGTLL